MIKKPALQLSFSISFIFALLFHLAVLFFVKKNPTADFKANFAQLSKPIRIDRIELIKPSEMQKIKRVGIKNGSIKDYMQPDMLKIPKAAPPSPGAPLTFGQLAPSLPGPVMTKKAEAPLKKQSSSPAETSELSIRPIEDNTGNIYFNPKKEKHISRDRDQDNLKQEAFNNITTSSSNPVAQKMSNFEIRYERPEGVSEDELNSDEKAYYSFFKRSYASYLSKLYATYNKVAVERPGIEKAFANKHVLLGRIDYDEKGNIILVKILKSSESDDIHYFFEETLKQLTLPNPPKSFVKSKKQFSTYYQIQIN